MGKRCSHLVGVEKTLLITGMGGSGVIVGVRVGTDCCSSALLLPQRGQDRLKPAKSGTMSLKNPALGKYWQDPFLQELQHSKVWEELNSSLTLYPAFALLERHPLWWAVTPP